MPVMSDMSGKPDWVTWSNFGLAEITSAEGFDRHFHDADEYWIIQSGRARVFSEGNDFVVGPGDVLCTRMGDEHDILDILDILESPLRVFWFEDELRGRKRSGHLHRPADGEHPSDAGETGPGTVETASDARTHPMERKPR